MAFDCAGKALLSVNGQGDAAIHLVSNPKAPKRIKLNGLPLAFSATDFGWQLAVGTPFATQPVVHWEIFSNGSKPNVANLDPKIHGTIAEFSDDGKMLVAADSAGSYCLWETEQVEAQGARFQAADALKNRQVFVDDISFHPTLPLSLIHI